MTGRIHTDDINDVCDALEKRLQFTEGMQYSLFAEDDKTIFAVIRALEVASEAVKHIPKEVRREYPTIPWRDILIHQYFGVNLEVVWKTVTMDIPELLPLFRKILTDKTNR